MFDEEERRARRLELTGKNGGPIEMTYKPLPTDEEKLARAIEIARILQEVGALPVPDQKAIDVSPATNGVAH